MQIKLETMPLPVARFLSYKLSIQGCSEKTVYEYGIDVNNFLLHYFKLKNKIPKDESIDLSVVSIDDIEKINSQDIYEYLLFLAGVNGNKPASRARKLSAIKSFFKFLYTKEHSISENPAKDIDAPSVKKALPKFLSMTESELLLRAAKENGKENTKRDFAILTFFLNCGMRVSELCGISLNDFGTDYSSMIVTGKGNKQRLIYLNESCRSALLDYLAERRAMLCKDERALFVSRNHRRLSVKTVQWLVYKYLKLAGLEEKSYSVHKLRHTAATLMYNTGKVDVRVLKDILGHEQLNTTQIYTHVSDERMREAMAENPLNTEKKD